MMKLWKERKSEKFTRKIEGFMFHHPNLFGFALFVGIPIVILLLLGIFSFLFTLPELWL